MKTAFFFASRWISVIFLLLANIIITRNSHIALWGDIAVIYATWHIINILFEFGIPGIVLSQYDLKPKDYASINGLSIILSFISVLIAATALYDRGILSIIMVYCFVDKMNSFSEAILKSNGKLKLLSLVSLFVSLGYLLYAWLSNVSFDTRLYLLLQVYTKLPIIFASLIYFGVSSPTHIFRILRLKDYFSHYLLDLGTSISHSGEVLLVKNLIGDDIKFSFFSKARGLALMVYNNLFPLIKVIYLRVPLLRLNKYIYAGGSLVLLFLYGIFLIFGENIFVQLFGPKFEPLNMYFLFYLLVITIRSVKSYIVAFASKLGLYVKLATGAIISVVILFGIYLFKDSLAINYEYVLVVLEIISVAILIYFLKDKLFHDSD